MRDNGRGRHGSPDDDRRERTSPSWAQRAGVPEASSAWTSRASATWITLTSSSYDRPAGSKSISRAGGRWCCADGRKGRGLQDSVKQKVHLELLLTSLIVEVTRHFMRR